MFPNLSVEQLQMYPGLIFYSGFIFDSPSEAEGGANALLIHWLLNAVKKKKNRRRKV